MLAIPRSVSAVWVDVGIGKGSTYEDQFVRNASIFMIAIEPTEHLARKLRERIHAQNQSHRLHVVQRACVASREDNAYIPFFVHAFHECNSLNEVQPGSPQLRSGRCTGDPPEKRLVPTCTLAEVLGRVPRALPIELLKVDVQGHEWECLRGAGKQIRRVHNVFLEAQDLPASHVLLYKRELTLGQLDAKLAALKFERQYCEGNNMMPTLRELNCLYTRQHRRPLWVTGRPQPTGVPAVAFSLNRRPPFVGVRYVFTLENKSVTPGALHERLTRLRVKSW